MQKEYVLQELSFVNCAAKIENKILPNIQNVSCGKTSKESRCFVDENFLG